MSYPDHATYRALYAKYYDGRDVGELLNLLHPLAGMHILDICGGDGRMSLAALGGGARHAHLIDSTPEMIPETLFDHPGMSITVGDVAYTFAFNRMTKKFDRAVCRQAVNYWLDTGTAQMIAQALKRNGILVFNTFNEEPSEVPRVKEYEYDGHHFAEISWRTGAVVKHVQVRDGMAPHCTEFWWLSPESIRTMLEPYFHVGESRHGKTSLYRCVRK